MLKRIKQMYWSFLLFFGAEICPLCGSSNVKQMGYEEYHHRHLCNDCGQLTWFT